MSADKFLEQHNNWQNKRAFFVEMLLDADISGLKGQARQDTYDVFKEIYDKAPTYGGMKWKDYLIDNKKYPCGIDTKEDKKIFKEKFIAAFDIPSKKLLAVQVATTDEVWNKVDYDKSYDKYSQKSMKRPELIKKLCELYTAKGIKNDLKFIIPADYINPNWRDDMIAKV